MTTTIEIRATKGGFALFAGQARMSKAFRTVALAERHYEANEALVNYWAGSASVCGVNSPKRTIKA